EVVVAGGGHPGSVRGLVVDQQAEGPLWVAALQEVQALLSDDVGGVAGQLLLAVRADHHGVDVGALVGVDPPVVEAAAAPSRSDPGATCRTAPSGSPPPAGPAGTSGPGSRTRSRSRERG